MSKKHKNSKTAKKHSSRVAAVTEHTTFDFEELRLGLAGETSEFELLLEPAGVTDHVRAEFEKIIGEAPNPMQVPARLLEGGSYIQATAKVALERAADSRRFSFSAGSPEHRRARGLADLDAMANGEIQQAPSKPPTGGSVVFDKMPTVSALTAGAPYHQAVETGAQAVLEEIDAHDLSDVRNVPTYHVLAFWKQIQAGLQGRIVKLAKLVPVRSDFLPIDHDVLDHIKKCAEGYLSTPQGNAARQALYGVVSDLIQNKHKKV